jgi:cell division protein FtsB
MELTQMFLWILGVACAVLGWFARELYAATQSLRKDLSALQVQIGTDYVRYDRLQDAIKPIMEAIKEINDKLSHRNNNG